MVLRYLIRTVLSAANRKKYTRPYLRPFVIILYFISIRNMDITSANFKERLPEIEKAIETATFVSIDGEFTGYNS